MSLATRRGLEILTAALLVGALGDALLRETPPGLNVLLWTLGFVAAIAVVAKRHGRSLRGDTALMVGALLLFAALFAWRDSPALAALNVLGMATALAIGSLRDPAGRARLASVADYAQGYVSAAAAAATGGIALVVDEIAWGELPRGPLARRAVAVGRGLLIALPLLLVFGALFAAADAVFRDLLAGAVPAPATPFEHALVVLVVAWVAAGLLREHAGERELEGALPSIRWRGFGLTEIAVVLGALNVLFLLFVLVQLRYLFGGASLVETEVGLTYAEYARRGFFELVTVTSLTLPLLLLADWSLRRERPRDELVFRCLAVALLLLLAVVMASALERMRLYQREYGLTELRLYTTAFMVWLGIVLVWAALTVLRGRRRLFAGGAVAAGLAAIVTLNALNPDGLIARVNIDRAAEGKAVDLSYLAGLSEDATPVLARRLPGLAASAPIEAEPGPVATALLREACERHDWRSWNLGRRAAARAVRAHETELLAISGARRAC